MICPHCNKTICEQDRYVMSRDPKAEMTDGMKLFGVVGLIIIASLILGFLIHLAQTHGIL